MIATWSTVLALGLVLGPQDKAPDSADRVVRLERCLISVIEEVDVPAQEAGPLVSVEAREGLAVEQGLTLALIDDRAAVARREVVAAEHRRFEEQAKNDVDIRFADAAAKVAEVEYRQALDANARSPGAFVASEIERLKLSHLRAKLQIEQAQMEQALARLAAEARRAELNQADIDIARRKVLAPLSGTVVDVKRRAGEWVNPGDSVFRIVQLDRLRVEAFVDSTRYSHEELENQPMRVEVTFPRGRKELFTGRVVFVDPQILQPGGLYRVWAEVENRKNAKDQWVLQPGRHVVMEITLPPVAD